MALWFHLVWCGLASVHFAFVLSNAFCCVERCIGLCRLGGVGLLCCVALCFVLSVVGLACVVLFWLLVFWFAVIVLFRGVLCCVVLRCSLVGFSFALFGLFLLWWFS